jgi:predicted O-methyltransferase YrrM
MQSHSILQKTETILFQSQVTLSQIEILLAESQNQLHQTEAVLDLSQTRLQNAVAKLNIKNDQLRQIKTQLQKVINTITELKGNQSEINQKVMAELELEIHQILQTATARTTPIQRVYIRGCPRSGNTLMLLLCGVGFKNSQALANQDIPIPEKSIPNKITFGTFPSPEGYPDKRVQAQHFLHQEDAAIIFMIRDPRDVLVSEHGQKPGEPWIKDPKRWIDNALLLKKMQQHERVIWVKYEDLVTHPNKVQEKIATALRFEIAQPFSECWKSLKSASSNYQKSLHGIRSLETSRIGNWQKTPDSQKYIAQKLQENPNIISLMKEWGYDSSDSSKNIEKMSASTSSEVIVKPPLLATSAVEFLHKFLTQKPNARVLEFGSGGSTIWFSTYTSNLVSIEHDPKWYEKVKTELKSDPAFNSVDLKFLSKPYYSVCDEFPDEYFDLILVDGRNRVRCAENSIRILKKGGILMLDDAQRPYYHRVHRLLHDWEYTRTIHPARQTHWWIKPATFNSFELDWKKAFKQTPVRLYAGSLSKQAKKDGWIGLAFHRSDAQHIKQDLTKPFPIPDQVVDYFQSEDVFEHIEPSELLAVTFPEIYRVMKPGGFIRISMPDYRCDYLIDRCWKDENGKPYYDPQGGGKWDAHRQKVTPGGHVWLPTYEKLRALIELSPLGKCQAHWLHYYDTNGQAVMNEIDYSKGYIMRTPDHDNRVKNPRRPLSIVLDLYK